MAIKSVVTGGAGFIGSHVAEALRRKGEEVVVVDLKAGSDIRDRAALAAACAGAQFVYHLAALPRVQYSIEHPEETHDTNVTGTLNVLLAARDAGVRRVVFSASSAAYGDQGRLPLVETMEPRPKSPYGLQKLIGERYCALFADVYGLETVSLRYFNVYGPGMDPNGAYALALAKFIKQRQEGRPMTVWGDGEQTRDFTHVRDVVRANLLAAESPRVGRGETINIGAGKNVSVNRMAALVGGPVAHEEARLEPRDTLADARKARDLLGWVPEVALEDGVAELKKLAGLV